MFWKIWRDKYLTSLREPTQTQIKTGRLCSRSEPCVGDVILLKDDAAMGNGVLGLYCN